MLLPFGRTIPGPADVGRDGTKMAVFGQGQRWRRGVAWSGVLFVVAAQSVGVYRLASVSGLDVDVVPTAMTFAIATATGAVVVERRPHNRVGWILWAFGVLATANAPGGQLARALADEGLAPLAQVVGWVASVTIQPALLLLAVVLPLVFPDGRLPGRRWTPMVWGIGVLLGLALLSAFAPGPLELWDGDPFPLANPVGIGVLAPVVEAVAPLWFTIIFVLMAAAVLSLVARYRRAEGEERQQVRVLLGAVALFAVALGVDEILVDAVGAPPLLDFLSEAVRMAALMLIPIAVGVAVLKYRLWHLDLLLNKVLRYGLLTAAVTGVYVAAVASVGAAIGTVGAERPFAGFLAAGFAAVAFEPLRRHVNRSVNRFTFGDSADPNEALRAVASRVADLTTPVAVLDEITAAVRRALHATHVALEARTRDGFNELAASGTRTGECLIFPLRHQGLHVGRLLVDAGTAPLTTASLEVVGDLTHHIAATVHAVTLSEDLRRSRERLVTAREEERRRLRRELHDGPAAALAGMVYMLQAAGNVVDAESQGGQLIGSLVGQAQNALGDVRRLVHDLRPPILDELGLAAALQTEAHRIADIGRADGGVPHIELDIDGSRLGDLSAALEVAAFRIACEAITNVCRHADARTCRLSMRLNGYLEMEITDDGRGIHADAVPGVGLHSMRERAQELGGDCVVQPMTPTGTRVFVRLPADAP